MCCWRLQPPWDVGATVSRGLDLKTHRGEKSTNRWMDLSVNFVMGSRAGQDGTGIHSKSEKIGRVYFSSKKLAGKVQKLQQQIFGTNIRKS